MIIPISSGSGSNSFAQTGSMPSETNLLMALATMHRQGRFDTSGKPDSSRSHHSPIEKMEKSNG